VFRSPTLTRPCHCRTHRHPRGSFQWFLDKGLAEAFNDISPSRTSRAAELELEFDPTDPDLRPPPKFTVEECKEKDMTYAAPVFVRARFLNATTARSRSRRSSWGLPDDDRPRHVHRERHRAGGREPAGALPGVIFQPGRDAKTIFTGTIHPYRGEWIELDVEAKPSKDVTAGPAGPQAPCLTLRAAACPRYGDDAFLERFVRHFDFLEGQWEKERNLAPTREEALLEIYKRARPGEPLSAEAARQYFENAFFNPKRYDLSESAATS